MLDDVATILLQNIPTAPKRVSTPDLRDALVTAGHLLGPRAVQKRLDSLCEQHAIVRHDASKPHQWSWSAGAKQKFFKDMPPYEALSLLLAREHLRALLPPRTLTWIDERLDKTEKEVVSDATGKSASWRDKVRRVPHELPRITPDVAAGVFKGVSEALYDGMLLELVYTKRFAAGPKEYVVHPIGLCERDGELWLAARKQEPDESTSNLRFFLLHRMGQAKVLRGRPAAWTGAKALDAAVAQGMAHFPLALGPSFELVARFHEDVIEKLEESRLAKDQTLETIDGTWTRLRATVPHTRALEKFLLGYGSLCVVESPAELRESIAGEHAKAAAAYAR